MLAPFIGWLIGAACSLAINLGIQYSVWGGNAPGWYAVPTALVGITGGFAGIMLGMWYNDRHRRY
jgi:hypothetical protein